MLIEKVATLCEAVNLIPVEAEGLFHSHVEVATFGEEIRVWSAQVGLV